MRTQLGFLNRVFENKFFYFWFLQLYFGVQTPSKFVLVPDICLPKKNLLCYNIYTQVTVVDYFWVCRTTVMFEIVALRAAFVLLANLHRFLLWPYLFKH